MKDSNAVQQWFNNLKRQEQMLLLIGAAAVLAYLVFVVILAPMSKTVDSLQQQNKVAAVTLTEVRELAEQYKVLEGTAPASGQSNSNLTRIIDSSVKAHKLAMSRFQPSSSGDVQVRFENVVFNHVLAWVNELENESGVLVKDLSVSPGAGAGLVNVSIRLRKAA